MVCLHQAIDAINRLKDGIEESKRVLATQLDESQRALDLTEAEAKRAITQRARAFERVLLVRSQLGANDRALKSIVRHGELTECCPCKFTVSRKRLDAEHRKE